MKSMNEMVNKYPDLLQDGELQLAYRAILSFVNKMKIKIKKEYPEYIVGTTYQGQMDISFFSVSTKILQEYGLKILVIYKHIDNTFYLWLSGRNREIARNLEHIFDSLMDNSSIYHDKNNKDSILEYRVTETPDFDHQEEMISIIQSQLIKFISMVEKQLLLKDGDNSE